MEASRPVTLKEAALDSPTFRGTVLLCFEQVDHIEKWLDGYLKSAQRLCDGAHGLEELVNVFLQRSIPVNNLDVMLDYDYTHLAMRRFAEGSREYWGHVTVVARKLGKTVIEPLGQLQRGELRNFKVKLSLIAKPGIKANPPYRKSDDSWKFHSRNSIPSSLDMQLNPSQKILLPCVKMPFSSMRPAKHTSKHASTSAYQRLYSVPPLTVLSPVCYPTNGESKTIFEVEGMQAWRSLIRRWPESGRGVTVWICVSEY